MHRVRTALTAALLLGVSLIWAGSASAGGPTSALLSVPGSGATASLYYTDPAYDDLAGLVGMAEPAGTIDKSGASHESGPGVTVTWLIHDVEPWRVDRIYLTGKGAPWVSTQMTDGSGSLWDSPVVWHQPTDAAALTELLDGLGLAGPARADGFDGVAGAPMPAAEEPAADAPPAVAPAPTESSETSGASGLTGIWWALGGLAVGVGATLLALRLRRRERSEIEESLEPQPAGDGVTVAEELAWSPRR